MDLLQVLAVAAVFGFGYYLFQPRAPLRIVVRGERVDVAGPAWEARSAAIAAFFRNELPEVTAARVDGYWEDRRLRLRMHGLLSPGRQQRIRNFLLNLK
jgi:hypothetical protein